MTETPTVLSSLEDHRRLTASVLQDLREVGRAAQRIGFDEVVTRVEQIAQRVEDDVFRIAVVGEFKRGKSTLINALLGREILPADVLPCSATLNRVTYGLQPSVRLVFKPDGDAPPREETIGIDELSDYVTKLTPDSEQRATDIQEAIVYYPVKYCRDKADIIDTPGLNDDEAMTRVTLSVLPQVDAALLVILAQSPFSSYEADFLGRMLTNDMGRVLFVVNRLDEIRRPKDRQRVIDLVRDRIRKAMQQRGAELHGEGTPEYTAFLERLGEPRVFGVSGGLALDAKLDDDAALLEESRFAEFESALERFLTIERGLVTLMMMTEATARAAQQTLQQISIRRGALHMEAEQFETTYAQTSGRLAELRHRLTKELTALETAARELRRALTPRARALPSKLSAAASQAIDGVPLDAQSIKRANAQATIDKLRGAVLERVQTVARVEAERTQLAIERAVEDEMRRLEEFGAEIGKELAAIEVSFAGALPEGEDAYDSVSMGVGVVAGALGGGLWGGAIGGAVSGYRVAGMKGAATGALAGATTSFATALGGLLAFSMIGLPLTWPVVLPTVAVAGFASTFGARWATNFLFSQERVERFREDFKASVLGELDKTSKQRVDEVMAAANEQVDVIFSALRAQVDADLGGTIEQTQRSLDDLRAQTARSQAARDHELKAIDQIAERMTAIHSHMRALHSDLMGSETRSRRDDDDAQPTA